MALIIRRHPALTQPVEPEPVQLTAPAPVPAPRKMLVFKRQPAQEGSPTGRPSTPPAAMDLPMPAGRKVFKVGGQAKPPEAPVPAVMTERQKKALIDSGLMDDDTPPPLQNKWEQLAIGQSVVITNSMFPWVKHYKPGDVATISNIMSNEDPLGVDMEGGHRIHIVTIDRPKEPNRKGQTAALFRWEFTRYVPEAPAPVSVKKVGF